MVENQPDRMAKNRTTLVVVPASITSQWAEEIAKHVDDGVMEHVYVYKSGCRPADDETVRFLRRQQVVITTYHEVFGLSKAGGTKLISSPGHAEFSQIRSTHSSNNGCCEG